MKVKTVHDDYRLRRCDIVSTGCTSDSRTWSGALNLALFEASVSPSSYFAPVAGPTADARSQSARTTAHTALLLRMLRYMLTMLGRRFKGCRTWSCNTLHAFAHRFPVKRSRVLLWCDLADRVILHLSSLHLRVGVECLLLCNVLLLAHWAMQLLREISLPALLSLCLRRASIACSYCRRHALLVSRATFARFALIRSSRSL